MDITLLQSFSNTKLFILLLKNGIKTNISPLMWTETDRNNYITQLEQL